MSRTGKSVEKEGRVTDTGPGGEGGTGEMDCSDGYTACDCVKTRGIVCFKRVRFMLGALYINKAVTCKVCKNKYSLDEGEKNQIKPSAATWTHLEIIILSEVSNTEKDEYHTRSLIRGI